MEDAIQSIVHFTSDVNIGTSATSECLLKTLVANMSYVNREVLYAQLFGEDSYINWDGVNNAQKKASAKKRGNCVGGSMVWVALLKFLHGNITPFQSQSASCRSMYRPFYIICDAITTQFKLKLTDQETLSLCVRAFFVSNIIGIAPMSVLEYLLGQHFNQAVNTQAMSIMVSASSEKFTPDQYSASIAWLISSGISRVDTVRMDNEIEFFLKRGREVCEAMKIHTLQVSRTGRPSLTDIVKNARLVKGGPMTDDGNYLQYFTFTGFATRMRYVIYYYYGIRYSIPSIYYGI